MQTHEKLHGRVVKVGIYDLYWAHCWLINHKVTVTPDEWVHDLGLISQAVGFPPGQDGRDAVARWIYVDSLTGDRIAEQVAS